MHIRDYVEHLRRKPVHVRERIAFGTSVAVTAVVALAWFGTLLGSGALALNDPAPETERALATEPSPFDSLLGAASAFNDLTSDAPNTAGVTTVETESATTIEETETGDGQTVIPF